ncbi:MAG: peroxidase family protein, partial [Myxococcota bacterium]
MRTNRKPQLESLETRTMLAADLPLGQNPVEPLDVNGDGQVAPLDALMVINALNDAGRRGGQPGFVDVDGDGDLSPLDAMRVINELNRQPRGDRSGPGPAPDDGRTENERQPANDAEPASIDGTGNNQEQPEWGSTDEALLRITSVEYADGISEPTGADRPSAREVSNGVAAQTESVANDRGLTDMAWLWGQFIDHDIDLTENAEPAEAFDIEVPAGDAYFDPLGTGEVTIGLNRSVYEEGTGETADDPRAQINQITAYIDGSVVYGSDQERADALRTFEGGRLETSEGDLLPFNEEGLANAGGTSETLFLAGDVRANENAALTAMQTVWVREHNRIADGVALMEPSLTDEEIYQRARSIVTAELQAITFNEFLPALLGEGAISSYSGYDPSVNAGISNVFSTAIYRFGHSMLSSELLRLNNDGSVADEGNLSLSEAFFAPGEISENGIDSILLGAASQQAQEIDTLIVDDVRNFLFGPPGAGGFDLAALNIQRGRDHGLADYNQVRVDVGLEPVTSFAEITSDVELQQTLQDLYGDVDNIDVWVGALAEEHVVGASVGELASTVISEQFERIRDGDSNWYQAVFSGEQLRQIEKTTLADVIERNTDITGLQSNVLFDATSAPDDAAPDGGIAGPGDGDAPRPPRDQPPREQPPREPTDQNVLTVRGTSDVDTIVVDAAEVTMNNETTSLAGIDVLRIETGGGEDDVQIAEDVDIRVVVAGRSDGRRGRREGHHAPTGPEATTLAEA